MESMNGIERIGGVEINKVTENNTKRLFDRHGIIMQIRLFIIIMKSAVEQIIPNIR